MWYGCQMISFKLVYAQRGWQYHVLKSSGSLLCASNDFICSEQRTLKDVWISMKLKPISFLTLLTQDPCFVHICITAANAKCSENFLLAAKLFIYCIALFLYFVLPIFFACYTVYRLLDHLQRHIWNEPVHISQWHTALVTETWRHIVIWWSGLIWKIWKKKNALISDSDCHFSHTATAPSPTVNLFCKLCLISQCRQWDFHLFVDSFLARKLEPAGRQGCHQHAVARWDLSRVCFSTSLAQPHWTQDISNTPPDLNRIFLRGREYSFLFIINPWICSNASAPPIHFLLRSKFA